MNPDPKKVNAMNTTSKTSKTAKPEQLGANDRALDAPPTGLAARIEKQGKPPAHLWSNHHARGPAGLYRVTHGSVTLGYEEGERVTLWQGGTVRLTAEEAGPLLASGNVERVEEPI